MSDRRSLVFGVAAVALAVAGCGGAPAPAPKSTTTPPPAAPAPATVAAAVPAPPPVTDTYEGKNRRDPFESIETRQGGGPTVAAAKLTGIVRGARGPMALVETADGLGYILTPGDTLGDGRLVEIGQDNVVFSVVPKPGSTTNRVVLRLPGD